MKVVTFVSQKGGSGKSTLACALAVAARLDGQRVALVDLDAQGSSVAWVEARNRLRQSAPDRAPDEIALRKVEVSRFARWVEEARARPGSDSVLLVVDTAGHVSEDVTAAIRAAGVVLVPVQPSPQDLRAVGPTVKQVRENAPDRLAFVLNRASPSQVRENAEIVATLERFGPVACTVHDRVEFKRAIGLGLGPHESSAAGKAAAEIDTLWEFAKGRIDG